MMAAFFGLTFTTMAQDREDEDKEKRAFKENLFTGGSVQLAFYNNTFLVGVSPVFGYSLTNWADAGVVLNYNYASQRSYYNDDKIRQTTLGGGAFVKLYPVRFLFAQAQAERNFIKQKQIYASVGTDEYSFEANSFLIGGGYTNGREGRGGGPHYYLAVLFDIGQDLYSPYVDQQARAIPIIRAGLQVPLFQGGKQQRGRDRYRD